MLRILFFLLLSAATYAQTSTTVATGNPPPAEQPTPPAPADTTRFNAGLLLTTPETFAQAWAMLPDSVRARAINAGIIRERARFNIALYGEGESYQGSINAQMRYKHRSQPDGWGTGAVAENPEVSLTLSSADVHSILMWAFQNKPHIAMWFIAQVFGGQMPQILPPKND